MTNFTSYLIVITALFIFSLQDPPKHIEHVLTRHKKHKRPPPQKQFLVNFEPSSFFINLPERNLIIWFSYNFVRVKSEVPHVKLHKIDVIFSVLRDINIHEGRRCLYAFGLVSDLLTHPKVHYYTVQTELKWCHYYCCIEKQETYRNGDYCTSKTIDSMLIVHDQFEIQSDREIINSRSAGS